MAGLRVAIVPVGRMDPAEVEAAAREVSKVLHRAVELREPAPLPRGTEDAARGQHPAGPLLAELRAALPRLAAKKLVGGAAAASPVATPSPDASVFVTDVDLFTPSTESVLYELDPARRAALVSVRRLREAFYRRKADPTRQRARLVKQMLYAIGRLQGLPECADSACALAATPALVDLDRKAERYCAACWRRLSAGVLRI